jgi:hypothetical protein
MGRELMKTDNTSGCPVEDSNQNITNGMDTTSMGDRNTCVCSKIKHLCRFSFAIVHENSCLKSVLLR